MKLYCKSISTPVVGLKAICTDNNIISLTFSNDNPDAWLKRYFGSAELLCENDMCRRCEEEINLYFLRKLKKFSLPVKLFGTPFQIKIWNALLKIPYGETASYSQVAAVAGVRGVRAAATAISKNPISIIVPCHRVVHADGSLGGFCGKLNLTGLKCSLLDLESPANP